MQYSVLNELFQLNMADHNIIKSFNLIHWNNGRIK